MTIPMVVTALALVLILSGIWFMWSDGDETNEVHAATPSSGMTLDAPRGASSSPAGSTKAVVVPPVSTDQIPQASKPVTSPLTPAVEGVIANWMSKAKKISKGKVTSKNTVVAVHVRDLDGQVWVQRNAAQAVTPASNLKLLTVASAAILAGSDAVFETTFEARGDIRDGILHGDLVVRAGADPMFDPKGDGGLQRWLDPLAAELKVAGIDRVIGSLVLDEGDYAAPGPAPAWPSEKEYWKEYCALAGGFTANAGCLTTTVSAGKLGKNASVRIRPKGHGLTRAKGTVITVAKGKPLDVRVGAMPRLVVKGKVPANISNYRSRFAHPDPVQLFGEAIVQGLAERGIAIKQGVTRAHNAAPGRQIASMQSPVLSTFGPILLNSNNAVADQLFLWMGHTYGERGDRIGGARAVATALARLKVSSTDWVQVDGSGLSKNNRVRADQMTALLAAVLSKGDSAAQELERSLPIAGQTGTLKKRMKDGPASGNVRAKTGFVNGTSSLSGTLRTARGQTLVFSILVRYPHVSGMNNNVFKPMQDELCQKLAGWSQELQ